MDIKLISVIIIIIVSCISCNGSFVGGERIVLKFDSHKGVTIDNRYIEPNYGFGFSKTSAPGCPKSIKGTPWLYYGSGKNRRCYLARTQGPCPKTEIFLPQKGTGYGSCIRNVIKPPNYNGEPPLHNASLPPPRSVTSYISQNRCQAGFRFNYRVKKCLHYSFEEAAGIFLH